MGKASNVSSGVRVLRGLKGPEILPFISRMGVAVNVNKWRCGNYPKCFYFDVDSSLETYTSTALNPLES